MADIESKPGFIEVDQTKFQQANENRDYTSYADLMDAATVAKARSIFPHFGQLPDNAVIIDKGSGTGTQAELAALEFRGATVYALDLSHELMERADNQRSLAKLVYGDATEQNFPDNSAHVIYLSTIGHEIVSFLGSEKMKEAVQVSYRELLPNGRFIIRDFLKPTQTEPLYMHIQEDEGEDDIENATVNGHIDYTRLSTKALFRQFHKEFEGGDVFDYEITHKGGMELIRIAPEWAHEFYLRKDYRKNWKQEIKEKYTYWTEDEARDVLVKTGFKDVKVVADHNHFILENRLKGKIQLFQEEDGQLIETDIPTTHFVAVGTKPDSGGPQKEIGLAVEDPAVDYAQLKSTIFFDSESSTLTIGSESFRIDPEKKVIKGSKKSVYYLEGDPKRVLKAVRTDGYDDHTIFKAMYQSIGRTDILHKYNIPFIPIRQVDPQGPPFRYFIQDAVPDNAVSAAELISSNTLTEIDIAQMASYINPFELSYEWQLDTNPFNWYRITRDDGTTEMTYVDGKVYAYDEGWEFRKIGLLQWLDPQYVTGQDVKTALIPKAKDVAQLEEQWSRNNSGQALLWKKYLNPLIQP